MPGLDHLLPFLAATLVFAVMPGPAILYTTAQTLARGRAGGLAAVFGIHIGGLAHVLAAAAGLSALFQLVPHLYLALKLAGALYLVWLGIQIVRGRGTADVPEIGGRGRRVFVQSVMVEVLNPKTALFFIAFLPQFVDPGAGWALWLQFLVLGGIVNLAFTLADVIAVFATTFVVARIRGSSAVQRLMRLAGGSILVGLGVHMAASRS